MIKTETLHPQQQATGEKSERMMNEELHSFTKRYLSICYYSVHWGYTTKQEQVCTFLKWVVYRTFLSFISVLPVNPELKLSS